MTLRAPFPDVELAGGACELKRSWPARSFSLYALRLSLPPNGEGFHHLASSQFCFPELGLGCFSSPSALYGYISSSRSLSQERLSMRCQSEPRLLFHLPSLPPFQQRERASERGGEGGGGVGGGDVKVTFQRERAPRVRETDNCLSTSPGPHSELSSGGVESHALRLSRTSREKSRSRRRGSSTPLRCARVAQRRRVSARAHLCGLLLPR